VVDARRTSHGKVCKRCGGTERRLSGRCVQCDRDHARRQRLARPKPEPKPPRPLTARQQALADGRKTYHGKPCPKHGTPERLVSNCNCVECMREIGRRPRTRPPEHSEYLRGWRLQNNAKCRQYSRQKKARARAKRIAGGDLPRIRRPKAEIVCDQCGKQQPRHQSQISPLNFCDSKCFGDWQRANTGGPLHHAYVNGYTSKYRTAEQEASRRLRQRISGQMWAALRGKKAGRTWETLVGYDVKALKRRLSRTMPPGYTWADLDKLDIDHIIPVSRFNLVSAEDLRRCWALKNLRLLPRPENQSKGSRYGKPFQPTLL
jgi:hypothetical protein